MGEVRNDLAVLHGVSAHNAAGRNLQAEDRIAGGRELMHQLLRRRAAIERSLVALFQNHNAASLDALIAGIHRRGDKVGEGNIGDKASALLHLQHRLFALFPLRNPHLAAQHSGVHAHVGNRLGQGESAAPRLPILARLRRRGQAM